MGWNFGWTISSHPRQCYFRRHQDSWDADKFYLTVQINPVGVEFCSVNKLSRCFACLILWLLSKTKQDEFGRKIKVFRWWAYWILTALLQQDWFGRIAKYFKLTSTNFQDWSARLNCSVKSSDSFAFIEKGLFAKTNFRLSFCVFFS